MLDRDRESYLFSLRGVGFCGMAIRAADGIMVGMAENKIQHIAFPRINAGVRRDVVTDVARADIAFGSVTRKTLRMRRNSGGNCSRGALRLMTRGAALRRFGAASRMQRVIERHIETFLESCRKRLQFRGIGLRICMTDRAYI